jgi:hypothetical protein
MRFVSVVSAVGVGLLLGSAAVVAPLVIGANPGSSTLATSLTWASQAGASLSALWSGDTPRPEATKPSQSGTITLDQPATRSSGKLEPAAAQRGVTPKSTTTTIADAKTTQEPWATQVTVEPDGAAPRKLTSSKPVTDDQRYKLVAELQTELARVGCYEGEKDGQWGPGTRRAMAAFTERVNASLPFDQPDLILLTLVQGHKGRACGAACPVGHSQNNTGRCVPTTVLAQGEKTKRPDPAKPDKTDRFEKSANGARGDTATTWSATSPVTGATAGVETGSIAGPIPAPVRVTRLPIAEPKISEPKPAAAPPQAVLAPKETTVAIVVPELSKPPLPVNRDTVFPGRMTMGAPLPPPDPASASVPSANNAAATKLAAVDDPPARSAPPVPVTAAEPQDEPTPRAVKKRLRPVAVSQPEPVQVRRRVPEPVVVVHRPPPTPRVTYVAPAQQVSSGGGSKSRRMIYEMFQRPDRN